MHFWLMKCEPDAYTIDDLKRDKKTAWEGVRNFQARNFMRDQMQVGDKVKDVTSHLKRDVRDAVDAGRDAWESEGNI